MERMKGLEPSDLLHGKRLVRGPLSGPKGQSINAFAVLSDRSDYDSDSRNLRSVTADLGTGIALVLVR